MVSKVRICSRLRSFLKKYIASTPQPRKALYSSVGDFSHNVQKVVFSLCGYGQTIGKNTFEQNSNLNKAESERSSWEHPALSYDYRTLVAHSLNVSLVFWQDARQGEMTGFPKAFINCGSHFSCAPHHAMYWHTQPLLVSLCSEYFPCFHVQKILFTQTLRPPHMHKMPLPTLWFQL